MTDFTPRSDFLRTLQERGFIHQCSDFAGLDALAVKGGVTGYIGFDATAPSLHAGSLVQIMMLHWLQKTGNTAIALMGGGTTMVGDPSGRDESRKMLTLQDIENNKDGIKQVFAKFLSFGSKPKDAIMTDNAEWLTTLNWIEMLRDIGKHFSVNRMLSMDSVKLRLDRDNENGLSFIEFNYMILQAYDFTVLAKRHGCNLQMGGSDQWGNIVNGIDLGRRLGLHQLYALTTPLLTTSSGAKMGKTAAGAVWLNADMLKPYDYWQYWRNAEDADVVKFLKLFTVMPMTEINRLAALGGAEINEAKKILANEATALVHGRDAAERAAETARQTFEEGRTAADLPTVIVPISGEAKARATVTGTLSYTIGVLDAFVKVGLVSSTSEARRQVQSGGLRVNDVVVIDAKQMLSAADALNDGAIKLSFGKKKHVLMRAG
jgi:tyrosyl-tRNA synthetase